MAISNENTLQQERLALQHKEDSRRRLTEMARNMAVSTKVARIKKTVMRERTIYMSDVHNLKCICVGILGALARKSFALKKSANQASSSGTTFCIIATNFKGAVHGVFIYQFIYLLFSIISIMRHMLRW